MMEHTNPIYPIPGTRAGLRADGTPYVDTDLKCLGGF